MRRFAEITLAVVCLFFGVQAFADGLPPSQLPKAPCDCSPCTCEKDCTCPQCANGCKKASSVGTAFVGFETVADTRSGLPASNLPPMHKETVTICNGTSCAPTSVDVPDGYRLVATSAGAYPYAPATYGAPATSYAAPCATCNQGSYGATYGTTYGAPMMGGGDCGSGGGSCGSQGRQGIPILRRIFRGRGGRGGCSGGGCGG